MKWISKTMFCLLLCLSSCKAKELKTAYENYIDKFPGYTWGLEQWKEDFASGGLLLKIEFETFDGEHVDPINVNKGDSIEITSKSHKDHASFAGWYYEENLETEISYSFVAEKSQTFYARFITDQVSVKFISKNKEYAELKFDYGSHLSLPENPEEIGYNFLGWSYEDDTPWDDSLLTDNLTLYAKYDYDFLNFPAIVVNTKDGSDIVSKETYVDSKVSILNTNESWIKNDVDAQVKGRGNSSWWETDKKSYRIKFDKKQSIFGSSYKAKSWTLIANAFDKSLLRNYLAYELSENFSGIDFTTKHVFVDLYLNNEYKGVYLLCDQIQTGDGRVPVDETILDDCSNGFFIEKDSHATDPSENLTIDLDYFVFDSSEYVIKTPDTEDESFIDNKENQINAIKNYLTESLDAIKNGTWLEVTDFVNIDSFVDSYIIDELFANFDCGISSCYFYRPKDGKLTKGPIWDLDRGAGNIDPNYIDGLPTTPTESLWAASHLVWYTELLKRDEFVELIKEQLSNYSTIISNTIELTNKNNNNSLSKLYKNEFERNFYKNPVLGVHTNLSSPELDLLTSFEEQVDYLKNWLEARHSYLVTIYS